MSFINTIKLIIFSGCLILMALFIITEYETQQLDDFCNDAKYGQEFFELIKNDPDNIEIRNLYASRNELCVKIKKNEH